MYVIVFVPSQAVGSTVVVIGWAVWQLFDQCFNQWQSSGLANVVLILKAGPGYKPPIVPASAWNSCYRVCVVVSSRVCVSPCDLIVSLKWYYTYMVTYCMCYPPQTGLRDLGKISFRIYTDHKVGSIHSQVSL